MGRFAAIVDLQFAGQHQATENGLCSSAISATDILKTNTLRALFKPFYRYSNNNLGLASVFNMKISTVCLWQNGPKLKIRETFTAASNMKWLVIR